MLALILVLFAGCYGPNAVPVDPNYPPEPPFSVTIADAGRG